MKKRLLALLIVFILLFESVSVLALGSRNVRPGNEISYSNYIFSSYPLANQSRIELNPTITIDLNQRYDNAKFDETGAEIDQGEYVDDFASKVTLNGAALSTYFANAEQRKAAIKLMPGDRTIVINLKYANKKLTANTEYILTIPQKTLYLRDLTIPEDNFYASTCTNSEPYVLRFRTGDFVLPECSNLGLKFLFDGKEVLAGKKGVAPKVREIRIVPKNGVKVSPGRSVDELSINYYDYGNIGNPTKHTKPYIDIKLVRNSSMDRDEIVFTFPGATSPEVALRQLYHYYIEVPKGFFTDGSGNVNCIIRHNFATASYTGYGKDIFLGGNYFYIGKEASRLYLYLLDDWTFIEDAVLNPWNYIIVERAPLDTDNWQKLDTGDFSFQGIKNRMEIESVSGDLSNAYRYRIKIRAGAIYLTNSRTLENLFNGKTIYNGATAYGYEHRGIIVKTSPITGPNPPGTGPTDPPPDPPEIYPEIWPPIVGPKPTIPNPPPPQWPPIPDWPINPEPPSTPPWPPVDPPPPPPWPPGPDWPGQTDPSGNGGVSCTKIDYGENRVSRNPVFTITFKYPIKNLDTSKIVFTSDAETFALDPSSISIDGNKLTINLGNNSKNVNLLRYDTAYRIVIGKGAFIYTADDIDIKNHPICVSFITGRDVEESAMKLSSDIAGTDDITKICNLDGTVNTTKLQPDGSIYITFYDKEGNRISVFGNEEELEKQFKLFMIPKAVRSAHYTTGELKDILYEFSLDGKSLGGDEREIAIKEVKFDDERTLADGSKRFYAIRVTPVNEFLNLNAYRILMAENNFLTLGGKRPFTQGINEKIWTAPNQDQSPLKMARLVDEKPVKGAGDYIGSEIVSGKFLAVGVTSDGVENAYKIQGSHLYSSGEPIRIPFNKWITFNPCCGGAHSRFKIEYGYYENKKDLSSHAFTKKGSISISKLGIEERLVKAGDNIETRSTLLIYPSQTLVSGHDYRLTIDLCEGNQSPIVSRGHIGIGNKPWNLYFTVEGEKTKEQAIYKFDWAGKNLYPISEIKDILRGVETGKDGEYYPLPKFKIYGYNFNERINSLTFRGPGGKTFVIDNLRTVKVKDENGNKIDTKPLIFDNVSMIEGYIPLDILRKMVEEKGACFSRDTLEGLYSLELSFANGRAVSIDTIKDTLDESEFAIVDRPYIYKSFPENGAKYIDADSLKSGNTTSFQNQEDRSNLRNELRDLADEIGADTNIKDIFDKISESNQNIDRLKRIFSGAYVVEREAQVRADIEKLFEWESDEVKKDYTDKMLTFYKGSKIRERDEHQRTYFDKFFAALDKFKTINGGGVLTQGLDKEPVDLLKDKYYIQVQYKDFLKSLALYPTAITGITMFEELGEGEAGKENYIDTAGKIYFTEKDGVKTFWIPLTKRPEENKEFLVTILENAFVEYRLPNLSMGNAQCSFRFSTNIIPRHRRMYEGTVPENYDLSYPIAIDMDTEGLKESKFEIFDNTKVYFRDEAGKIYNPARQVLRKDKDGGVRIYVFLPSPRLKVGRYDIILSNTGENIKSEYVEELVYAVFSVVKKGDLPPNEIFWIKTKKGDVDIKAYRDTSRDDVILKRPNIEMGKVEMDLEDFTKTTALTRNLEIPNANAIGELVLRSKEGEVNFKGVKPVLGNVLRLKVGGVPAREKAMLRGKLKGYHVKSEFFRISDSNFSYSEVMVNLKYEGDDIEGYKILIYDDKKRKFIELETEVDEMNQMATGKTVELGVFVVAKKR